MKTEISSKNTMKGWNFTSNDLENALKHKVMLNPSIDLTNACNLNCPYCYIEEKNSIRKKRRPDELTFDETIGVIDECAKLGAKTINLVGAGEPTIDAYFCDIVRYIFSKNMTTVLFTNGIKLMRSEKIVDFLFENDVTVVLKMNSFNADVQNLMAGKEGYHQQSMKVLKLLMDRGFNKTDPTRLSINCVACQGNVDELFEIHSFCRENTMYPMIGDFIPTGRTEAGEFVAQSAVSMLDSKKQELIRKILVPLTFEQKISVRNKITHFDISLGIPHSGCAAYYSGGTCTQILAVYVDIVGNVWPCVARSKRAGGFNDLTDGLLGNIRNGNSICTIWNTDPYLERIRAQYDGGCPYKAPL